MKLKRETHATFAILLVIILFATSLTAQNIREYDPFSGFHFGYTASVGITRPCDVFPNIGDYPSPEGLPGCSYLAGIEASYHFADFFGVSVGLEYGDTWRQKVRIQYPLRGQEYVFSDHYSSLYFPVKFEMHLPVGDRFHLFSDFGVRLGTVGFLVEMGRLYGQHFDNAEQGLVRTDDAGNENDVAFCMAYDLLPNTVTEDSDVDILVVFDQKDGNGVSLLRHIAIALGLEDLLGKKVDLITDGTLLPFAQTTADNDKILIYERAT